MNTTLERKFHIRWCCIDPLRPPVILGIGNCENWAREINDLQNPEDSSFWASDETADLVETYHVAGKNSCHGRSLNVPPLCTSDDAVRLSNSPKKVVLPRRPSYLVCEAKGDNKCQWPAYGFFPWECRSTHK